MRVLRRAHFAVVGAAAACTAGRATCEPQKNLKPSLVLFSGGTAMNSLAAPLSTLTPRVAHVLPVSDDGGSTAEIVRVLGGPAVGDIRSRCLRLSDESTPETAAVKRLLQHRLPPGRDAARAAWLPIVEGTDALWGEIEAPYKHTIRAFLVHFHTQILVHAAHEFDFSNGSVGNFFFAGARIFLNSLNAAIFLFSRVSGIARETEVLPALRSETDKVVVLGAELADGALVRGQNAISHPAEAPSSERGQPEASPTLVRKGTGGAWRPLPSPIRRVLYVAPDARGASSAQRGASAVEVAPPVNPLVLRKLREADAIVFGCGSLYTSRPGVGAVGDEAEAPLSRYTSICASLIVEGVGEAVAARRDAPKVLMLNASPDRETHRALRGDTVAERAAPMAASDYVRAVARALNREGSAGGSLAHPASAFVDVLLYPKGCEAAIPIDRDELTRLGVRAVAVDSTRDAQGRPLYDPQGVLAALSAVLADRRDE